MENNLKNSIEFLNYKVGKQHGFTIPENYFNELENEILNNQIASSFPDKNGLKTPENYFEKLENDLIERIPEITLPKKTDLGVPQGYFDSLEDSIFDKIKLENTDSKEVKVISLYQKIKKFIPATAAASVILFVSIYFFKTTKETESQIKEAEIVTWFQNGYGEANAYELATLLSNEDLNYDEFTVNVSTDNIEDYLNTVDTSTLIEFEEIDLNNNDI
ncbi:hypothetical protein EV195_11127 [Tenacibaculum skagerrakense]|uniref:Uncharacterized protein n=1 Tax=Tenacibaculum skagerrakense TaxID=186571 RepID=A0A4R2NLT9_9FLAO|nr:hypothetical protein [Tenacibaculum skagerrakense]TCP22599.1 hypothetical protein EV195_11127 [Tenacibaculum skagerrakense]